MKKLRKALVCVALLCCLSVSVLGCSGGDTDGNNQGDANASVSDSVEDNQANDGNQETDEQGNAVTNADNTSNDGNSDAPKETVALTDANGNVVTDANGNTVTQIVVDNGNKDNSTTTANGGQTTDKEGNPVTDEQGNPVTNAGVTVTDDGGNSSSSGNNANGGNSSDNNQDVYFAKNRYSTFIWMSEDTSNKCESGVMVEVAVKVLDDAKSGEYPIDFNYVELYDTNGNEVPFTVQNGKITVGQASSVSEQGAASSGVNYRLDTATAQPGDVVKLKVHLDNNTGIAVTRVELKYDNKALEIQSISASGAFADQVIESGLNLDKSIRQ